MPNPESEFEHGTTVPTFSRELGTRLREIENRFKNREEAAAACGVAKSTFQRWVEGKSDPSFEGLSRLADATGISLDWLAKGVGESGLSEASVPTLVDDSFVRIPRYNVEASAGPGAFSDSEHVVDYMAFREDFVRRTLRADPANLVLITAVGDSMEPAIRAGDLLLIDRGVDRIQDDAIYVLVKRGEIVVKRVQQFFDGAVAVKSDNPAYVEETLGPGEADQVIVAGRVRWIGRLI